MLRECRGGAVKLEARAIVLARLFVDVLIHWEAHVKHRAGTLARNKVAVGTRHALQRSGRRRNKREKKARDDREERKSECVSKRDRG